MTGHYTMSPDNPSFAVPDDDTESQPPSLKEAIDYAVAKLRDPAATTHMRLVASSDLSEAYWAHVEGGVNHDPR